jgi:hypothetical protein
MAAAFEMELRLRQTMSGFTFSISGPTMSPAATCMLLLQFAEHRGGVLGDECTGRRVLRIGAREEDDGVGAEEQQVAVELGRGVAAVAVGGGGGA